jgi:hypothetical protein
MLKKSSVFMMLLAASLIGIGSVTYIQPQVQVAQGQPLQKAPVLKQQEKALADRILPYIIQNMGGQTLAQKVLPYLEITPIVIMRPSSGQPMTSLANCNPGEKVVGGGFQYSGPVGRQTGTVVSGSMPWGPDGWISSYSTSVPQQTQTSKITSYVMCLSVNIALKGTQPSTTTTPLPK